MSPTKGAVHALLPIKPYIPGETPIFDDREAIPEGDIHDYGFFILEHDFSGHPPYNTVIQVPDDGDYLADLRS